MMRLKNTIILAIILSAASGTLVSNLHVVETGNDTLVVEWITEESSEETTFSIILKPTDSNIENQNHSKTIITKERSKPCRVEFSDLKPLTEYSITVSTSGDNHSPATLHIMTRPSLEMPEIDEVQEGTAYITLNPLSESEAKNVMGYLLLIQPLEDAKNYPEDGIKLPSVKADLEKIIKPPFYIAYEFTQEQLLQENGGQVQVGTGTGKRDGKYGILQDPKLQSGAFYRVAFVVIIKCDGKETMFAEESCHMLIK